MNELPKLTLLQTLGAYAGLSTWTEARDPESYRLTDMWVDPYKLTLRQTLAEYFPWLS